jgi:hypothetical protein
MSVRCNPTGLAEEMRYGQNHGQSPREGAPCYSAGIEGGAGQECQEVHSVEQGESEDLELVSANDQSCPSSWCWSW